jgi:multiple sugar transport system permease protein
METGFLVRSCPGEVQNNRVRAGLTGHIVRKRVSSRENEPMTKGSVVLSRRAGFVFLLPALIFIFLFILFPLVWVFFLSFTNQTLTGDTAANAQFVGLENYQRLFDFSTWMNSGEFGNALRNSAIFVFGSAIIGQVGLGLSIAWAFNRRRGPLRETIYTLVTLAWIIPDTVVAFTWVAFLDRDFGSLNAILGLVNFPRIDWLIDQPLLSIILFNTWRGTAFSMLLFSSALATIPPSYLETAEVVGASAWQKFRDILLPLIRNHILTDIILVTLWTFNTFSPYLITGGGPAFKSELVSIHTFRVAFRYFEFGRGGAIAVTMMVINLILALIYLMTLRRQEVRR